MMAPAHLLAATAAGAVLTVGGCLSPDARQERPLPAGPAVVDVAMSEYRIKFSRDIPAGRVVFRVRNRGELDHSLDLVALDEDLPPLEAQLRGSQRRPVAPFGYLRLRAPGEQGTFAVDLVAGRRYGLLCYVRDPDGRSHAVKGMNAEFRPGGPGDERGPQTRRGGGDPTPKGTTAAMLSRRLGPRGNR